MKPGHPPARAYVVNWTAWGTFAAALMPLAQVSPPLRLFGLIALFFGGMFFLYALKYYVSMALILLANGGSNGNGNGHNGNGLRNGKGRNGNGLRNGKGRNGNGNGLRGLTRNGAESTHLAHEPLISIHLPIFNEPVVVDRLLQACTSLTYSNYEVVVADDSTDQTSAILDRNWAAHQRVKLSRRRDRVGFKGGALEQALQVTDPTAEFIAVFDADFIPPPDILQQFITYFYGVNGNGNGNGHGHSHGEQPTAPPQLVDDRLAAVQGYQWHILNASENWITRGIRAEFSGSYVIERSSQELIGAMKMISGSVFMIRADVLRQHGWGTSITEDWELTLRLYLNGYKILYTPFIQAPSECVAKFIPLARQRMRWAEGHTYNVKKYFLPILSSPHLSLTEKLEFVYYAPYYLQSVFFLLGTSAWLASELLVGPHLPVVPATLGWGLLFTNLLALVLMNLTGLFMERGVRRNWSGLISFVVLTFMLVPFQAFAALKGLLEPTEGGWHRTQKTGVITEMVDKLGLGRRIKRLLPKPQKKGQGRVDLGKRLGLAPLTVGWPQSGRRSRRFGLGLGIASAMVIVLVLIAVLAGGISAVSAAPDIFYLHTPTLNDGEQMNNTLGSGGSTLAFDTVGQIARWYTELSYPTGGDDATVAAGSYSFTLYFDQLPGRGWWDANYDYRKQVTVSTGTAAVGAGYSVSFTFDHASLGFAGKSRSDGDDLRVAFYNGSSWVELDRVLDTYSAWDGAFTKIWFSLQAPIGASSSDDRYYIYYGHPPAVSPPDDPAMVFTMADSFEDGILTPDLAASTAGAGAAYEDLGFQEAIIDAPADVDAAILLAESALPLNLQLAIRHLTKLETANFQSTLLGIVQDEFEPATADSATEDARRRIMVTHDASTTEVFITYLDTSDVTWYWDGLVWGSTPASYDLWNLNEYHAIEFYADGTNWWIELRDEFGGFIDSTTPVAWSVVKDTGPDDFWFYWGEPYDDQYQAFQSSNWVSLRDYVSPEPTTAEGAEETPHSADLTLRVAHTDADGGNPTPVTSQSTTVDAFSANPIVIALGSGSELTFTAANPQRLRIEIEVDNLTTAGDFVMAYDSASQPSSLDTPVVTVPEFGLAFIGFALSIPSMVGGAWRRRRVARRARAQRDPFRYRRRKSAPKPRADNPRLRPNRSSR